MERGARDFAGATDGDGAHSTGKRRQGLTASKPFVAAAARHPGAQPQRVAPTPVADPSHQDGPKSIIR